MAVRPLRAIYQIDPYLFRDSDAHGCCVTGRCPPWWAQLRSALQEIGHALQLIVQRATKHLVTDQ